VRRISNCAGISLVAQDAVTRMEGLTIQVLGREVNTGNLPARPRLGVIREHSQPGHFVGAYGGLILILESGSGRARMTGFMPFCFSLGPLDPRTL